MCKLVALVLVEVEVVVALAILVVILLEVISIWASSQYQS